MIHILKYFMKILNLQSNRLHFVKENHLYQLINNVISEMEWWACFKPKITTTKALSIKHDGNVKLGRNDPCPCGSGKKYKKCCL